MKKYLKKIQGLFLSLLIAIGTFLTPFTSSASAITTVNAEGNIEGYVYDVIREMTGIDLSDKSTWVNWSKIGNITYSYQPSVGNDAWHVTSDAVPSAYAGQSFDCVRTALFITGHALQKAGQEPTSYITKVGYDFNGNGKFTTSTDYTQAKTGDILAYGESHLGVALGWKDGELWTIDGMDGYGWGIHKYRGYASSGSTQHVFTMLYEVPHTKTVNVNVTKQSLYPDCTNSNALYSLAGAEFSVVTNTGQNLGTLTTNENGNASGSWEVSSDVSSVTVTETKAPSNYKLTDGTPKVIQLADGTTASYTWIDEPISDPAIIELKKVDKDGKVVDSWTSTKKSHNIEGLNRNETYTLTEEIAPKGYYYSNDVTFTVDDNGKVVQKVEMIDNLIKYQIAKVDDYGNYVENVKLELTDVTDSNNPVKIELENGGITTKKPFELYGVLTAEHKYELVEKEHVAGVYKATKIDFTVAKYGTSEVHTITMYDDTTNVMVSKVDNHGTAVKGAKLSILEAVKNEDGTITPVLNEDGTEKAPVYSFTSENKPTDISKYVKGSNEESGDVWYILREDETPFGFETLEDQPFKVTGTKDEHQVIVAVDQRKTFYVSAVKVDANDKTKLLKGAEITLFKSDGTVAKDVNGNECKGLTDGKGVITWQVEYNGDGTGTKDSYDAGYYVQETKAPTGYRINNDHHAVTMSEDYEWSKDNAVKIVVNDTALPATSIKTGDMSNIALWGGILLFSVCGGALVIFLKKKNGTSEE